MKTSVALLFCGLRVASAALDLPSAGSMDKAFFVKSETTNWWIPQAAQPDGKVLAATYPTPRIARFNPDGSLDSVFVARGISLRRTTDLVVDWPVLVLAADAKVLVGMRHGSVELSDGTTTALARLNADGSLDASFNYHESKFFSPVPKIIAVPDGSVLVDQLHIMDDGSVDKTFRPKLAECAADTWRFEAWQPDGRLLLRIRSECGVSVVRFMADGSDDATFHPAVTDGDVATVQVMADKKILILGPFSSVNGQRRFRLARLHENGSLDQSFLPPEEITSQGRSLGWDPQSMTVQTDGRIVVNGILPSENSGAGWIARLNTDGRLDSSFSFAPTVVSYPLDEVDFSSYNVLSLLAHPDGGLWVATAFVLKNECCLRSELLRLRGDVPVVRVSVGAQGKRENQFDIRIRTDAVDGSRIVVQGSSSLGERLWQPIATNTVVNGGDITITEVSGATATPHFFRAVLP